MFEAYLLAERYDLPEHEPELGVGKHPDYVVERDDSKCVCEVKEFAHDTNSLQGGRGTTALSVMFKRLRSKIREAARQLKPLQHSGLPLVVVITNPHRARVIAGDQEIIWAMYGDPVVRFGFDPTTGTTTGDGLFTVDRNGKLRGDHPYISAIAFVGERHHAADYYDRLAARNAHLSRDARLRALHAAANSGEVPDGSYLTMSVFATMSPTAVPLPEPFFNGPQDRWFAHDADDEVYRQVRGPTR
jgi:hypothetical protein